MISITFAAVPAIRVAAGPSAARGVSIGSANATKANINEAVRAARRRTSNDTVSLSRIILGEKSEARVLAHQREVVAPLELGLGVGLLALLADQFGALLGIGAAQRRVVVDAVLLEI